MTMDTLIFIPARMASERLPGKPLEQIDSRRTLLSMTYHQAMKTGLGAAVRVLTPDKEIMQYCSSQGILGAITPDNCPNGTVRACRAIHNAREEVQQALRCVIVWQVDEPCVDPQDVLRLQRTVLSGAHIATLAARIDEREANNEDIVKTVLVGPVPHCQWFSRAPLRGAWGHVGVYAFSAWTLARLDCAPSNLAQAEGLEQLTWLEQGYKITAVLLPGEMPLSVNNWDDLELLRKKVGH